MSVTEMKEESDDKSLDEIITEYSDETQSLER
jgi:hypothetical protein